MSLTDIFTLISVPIAIISTSTMAYVAVAIATKEGREQTIREIQSFSFGIPKIISIVHIWAVYFHLFFGKRVFSKRQLVSIPIYTLTVSFIFFATWIAYLYLFKNPDYSFTAPLPLTMKQSLYDFYHKGIYAALLIDFITIQLTKKSIKMGYRFGFGSFRFVVLLMATFIFSYFIFSVAVLCFRIDDMVRLYLTVAPYDSMPVIKFEPINNILSSLSLFHPQTLIHVTSQGTYATYFMPEPLIFYCAVITQLSLIFITFSYFSAFLLEKLKNFTIGFAKTIGSPLSGGYGFVVLSLLTLLGVPVVIGLLFALSGS